MFDRDDPSLHVRSRMNLDPAASMAANELETRTFTVVQLLDAIRKGRVRLPHFQRGFRWTDDDRLALFDSLQQGFPIGTLLLAQAPAPADQLSLGGYIVNLPPVSTAFWVVDGQQRTATLAMALLEDHSGTFRPIYFDLNQAKFALGTRRRTPPSHWVPSHVLLSSSTLNKWLRESIASDELSNRADEIAGRVREYTIPAYLVPYDGKDDSLLRQIFARTNRRGRTLDSYEVFDALHKSLSTEHKPTERVHGVLGPLGFGELEGRLIERAAVAVAGGSPGRTLEEVVASGAIDVSSLFDRVAGSLALSINFLVEDAGVPHKELLPFSGVLCSLARFFALFPAPHPRNKELLSRWFWRGTLTGDHRTDNGTDGKKWQAIQGDEHGSVQRLLRALPPVPPGSIPDNLAPIRRLDAARTRIELLALAARRPRMLTVDEAGTDVPLAQMYNRGEAGSLPWSIVKAPNEDRTTAGLLLHPPLKSWEPLFTATEEALASHAIGPTALAALRRGDDAAFLEQRAATLGEDLQRFLLERTALDPPDRDRAPLDAYFDVEQT